MHNELRHRLITSPATGSPRFRRSTRLHLTLWFAICLGLLALAVTQEIWSHKHHFEHATAEVASRITDRTLIAETALEGFTAFVHSLQEFNHSAAADYADTLLNRYPFLYMFEVAERVQHSERASRESQLASIYPGFHIRQFDYEQTKQWVSAPTSADYYPIVFQWPAFTDHRQIVGLDLRSSDVLIEAKHKSFVLGLPVATRPFVLAENVNGYVIHRALDELVTDTNAPLTANRYTLLALRSDRMFGRVTSHHPELSVDLTHPNGSAVDGGAGRLLRTGGTPSSALERWILPDFEHSQSLAISVPSQPFQLTSRSQMTWRDINLPLIVGLIVLMLAGPFLIQRFAVAYFDNRLAGMDREGVLYQMANFDSLTGVANRHRLIEQIELNVLRADRDGARFCLFFLDIDAFKGVNDNLGHAAGDAVLIEFSQRLSGLLRTEELLGRLGGDEFVLLTSDNINSEDAPSLISRIQKAMNRPFRFGKQDISISVSVGHACFPDDGRNIGALLDTADRRMYAEKTEHRENSPG